MSLIHLGSRDDLVIVTTAISNDLWRDRHAQIELKTSNGQIEIHTNNLKHLLFILDVVRQLKDDMEGVGLPYKQVRTRVFDFVESNYMSTRTPLDKGDGPCAIAKI